VRHPADTRVNWNHDPVSLGLKLISGEYLKRYPSLYQDFVIFKSNIVISAICLPYLQTRVVRTRDFFKVVTIANIKAIFEKDGAKNLIKMPQNLFCVPNWDIVRHDEDVAVLLGLRSLS